jgi:hypothetical protein
VAYLPADVDRTYWRLNQPDHGALLASLVRWAAHDDLPVRVAGPGYVDVHAYTQPLSPSPSEGAGRTEGIQRFIVHLVNLTHAGAWKAPVDELTPVGEQRVTVRLPDGTRAAGPRLLVAGATAAIEQARNEATAVVPSVLDHEVLVIEVES